MGTGPFKFVSYAPLESFIIEKNAELAEKEYQLAHKMEKNYPNLGEAESELEMLDYVKANEFVEYK